MVDKKLTKEAKAALDSAIKVLEHAMELASEKEDLEAMIAISDRLMMLYQSLTDKSVKKFKAGFSLINPDKPKPGDDDDESDNG